MRLVKLLASCAAVSASFGCFKLPASLTCYGYIAPGLERVGTEFSKTLAQRGAMGARE